MEPKMRRRMEGETMTAPEPEEAPADGGQTPNVEGSKPTTIVKKEMLGGKNWKPGDRIIFEFKAIDPETGDGELFYPEEEGAAEEESPEPTDSMEAMDQQLPAEEPGY